MANQSNYDVLMQRQIIPFFPHNGREILNAHKINVKDYDTVIIYLWKTSRRKCMALARQQSEEASHQRRYHQEGEVLLVVVSTSIRREKKHNWYHPLNTGSK